MHSKLILALLTSVALAGQAYAAVDVEKAKAFAKKNGCLKCHAPSKTKNGPSVKQIAADIREKGETDADLIEHLTTGKKVKRKDGIEVDHRALEKSNEAEIDNLIQWIKSH